MSQENFKFVLLISQLTYVLTFVQRFSYEIKEKCLKFYRKSPLSRYLQLLKIKHSFKPCLTLL